jgi:hypothetical protein
VRTIRPDVTYARDIEEDPMLEEFAASLTSDRPAGRDFSERLPSPTSEAPVVVPIVAATTLEDQDPTDPTTEPFGWNYKPAEKHCWLIFCERKILFWLKKQAE